MVLLYQGKTYLRSKALVQILTLLGSYPLTTFSLKCIPSFLSDAVYRVIARFRYRLGKAEQACELLDQELQQKLFLD